MALMHPEDLLTIVLPLYGRSAYTIRFLKYWEAVKSPFQLLIVDGSKKSQYSKIKGLLNRRGMRYIRCKYDEKISDYMEKMVLAFDNVNTPLSAMVDNDDLFSIKGYIDGINFLGNNADYIGYREEMKWFIEREINRIKSVNIS